LVCKNHDKSPEVVKVLWIYPEVDKFRCMTPGVTISSGFIGALVLPTYPKIIIFPELYPFVII